MRKCFSCDKESRFSILLCVENGRIYIPNQFVREDTPDQVEDVGFCSDCMRKIEDNLRATVLYLQTENHKP